MKMKWLTNNTSRGAHFGQSSSKRGSNGVIVWYIAPFDRHRLWFIRFSTSCFWQGITLFRMLTPITLHFVHCSLAAYKTHKLVYMNTIYLWNFICDVIYNTDMHVSSFLTMSLWYWFCTQWRTQEFFFGVGGFNNFSWGQRTVRTGIWGRWTPSQGFWRQL